MFCIGGLSMKRSFFLYSNGTLKRKDNTITQVEMAKILGITRDGISYNIRILREKGILERIGSTKNGMWKIYDKI